ncbi:MAG: hypothetical protein DI544_03895 [Sphingomonas taxi]|uniref:Response regulatory domain-containing protein n=1 Tax=Sphingomonas taxi TaxID=1549858 RepID=A0A2W5QVR2_9SPHN|nr:MAG: hypothetical protein DI544_03895 [Sphingomonas taxi]
MLVEDMLSELGFEHVESAMAVAEALPLATDLELSFAILDVNLGDQRSFAIADVLRARGVPFLFATGYGARGMEGDYVGSCVVQKPFRRDELAAAIERVFCQVE